MGLCENGRIENGDREGSNIVIGFFYKGKGENGVIFKEESRSERFYFFLRWKYDGIFLKKF